MHTTTSLPESSRDLSLEDAVGQMLLIGFRGRDVGEDVEEILRDIKPGGVILFDRAPSDTDVGRNIESPEQVRALTKRLRLVTSTPLFIAVDAEGGYVNRLKEKYGFSVVVPTALELGAGSVSDTERIAGDLAREMSAVGINWNFAPVVDVNIDPESPAIGYFERSFSEDPATVVLHAEAFAKGLRAHMVIPTLKHFPGHGSAAGDTHLGVADVTETYRSEELEPYRQMIAGGYADPIMTAHIVNRTLDSDAVPATLSPRIITGLLREDFGFDGVIISDDMYMGAIVEEYGVDDAAVKTIQAGVDIVLLARQFGGDDVVSLYAVRDSIVQAVVDGRIPEERIYASVDRILNLKRAYAVH